MITLKQSAHLKIRLRGYEKPDTGSQLEGYLEPGRYIVDAYQQNYPDERTDYALVQAPFLGDNDTWICTRWKKNAYADIIEEKVPEPEPLLFKDDALAIPERNLTDKLQAFQAFTYDRDRARYPFPLPGVNLPLAPPNTNNCCTFVEGLLVGAWADAFDTFKWSPGHHGQMMILSADDYFSPVTAVVDAEMGLPVTYQDGLPHPWTVVQGWREQWRGGHTFIIVDHHVETDRVLTLESNSAYTLNGVGFRSIGNLRDVDPWPPEDWWQKEDLWTWDRICSTYRFRQQARLKVKERSWTRL